MKRYQLTSFHVGRILYFVVLGLLLIVLPMLAGCATTEYARAKGTGAHIISAYGIASIGVFEYERAARPENKCQSVGQVAPSNLLVVNPDTWNVPDIICATESCYGLATIP